MNNAGGRERPTGCRAVEINIPKVSAADPIVKTKFRVPLGARRGCDSRLVIRES